MIYLLAQLSQSCYGVGEYLVLWYFLFEHFREYDFEAESEGEVEYDFESELEAGDESEVNGESEGVRLGDGDVACVV